MARKPQASISAQREQILQAASRLLATGGAEALRVRDIAEAANCSTMGVYSHFGGKDGLVEAIYVDGFERFEQALRKAVSCGEPSGLRRVGRAYRDWAIDNPGAYKVMFVGAVPGFVPSEGARMAALGSFGVLVDCVAESQELGELAAGDVDEIAWALWGLVHGLSMLELEGLAADDAESVVVARFELAVDAAIRGFSER